MIISECRLHDMLMVMWRCAISLESDIGIYGCARDAIQYKYALQLARQSVCVWPVINNIDAKLSSGVHSGRNVILNIP